MIAIKFAGPDCALGKLFRLLQSRGVAVSWSELPAHSRIMGEVKRKVQWQWPVAAASKSASSIQSTLLLRLSQSALAHACIHATGMCRRSL